MCECLYALFLKLGIYKSFLVSGGGWGKLESKRGECSRL